MTRYSIRRRRAVRNRGFTLLEVVLSLSIALVVLAAVALAIDLHLRVVDRGRVEVEQAQLARAVLRRMADDLRSAIRYEPIDFDALVPSVGLPEGLGEGGEEEGDDAAGGGGDADEAADDAEEQAEEGAQSVADSAEPETVPGLYGNEFELQVDVGRLPRIEDFGQFVSADGTTRDHLSDVKTVAYYVRPASHAMTETAAIATAEGGLVRRELARAAALFAYENGGLVAADRDVEPFAPEVTAARFRYFDGTEFVTEWDSTERQGLPLAVEITIEVAPTIADYVDADGADGRAADEPVFLVYQLLVHLPAAEPTDEEATAAEDEEEKEGQEEEDADSQAGGQAGGNAPGGGGGAGTPGGTPGGGGQP